LWQGVVLFRGKAQTRNKTHRHPLCPALMVQVSYAMGIVGVQKGYGKIRWLDMLGHRIFPRYFWGIWERRFADLLEQLIRYLGFFSLHNQV